MSGQIEKGDCGGVSEERLVPMLETLIDHVITRIDQVGKNLGGQLDSCGTKLDKIVKDSNELVRESKELNCMCSNVGSDVSRINNLLDMKKIKDSSTRIPYFYGGHSEANSGIDEGDWSEY